MIKKTYHWKEITNDGLVKELKEFGPQYDSESLNGWCGFDSEDEAIENLIKFYKKYPYERPSDMTLIIKYEVVDEEKHK